ncbi:hypothetical protein F442_11655 [Phytophthora nicotianae P10297]|uniref:Uncharacterized protein n=1 Tax=Phytophthora nicotianae P10297 TaxID=1317064 RepID=W2Z157_PHYNI|nr:hypothetical protein F442_11655 [Phytophthora nicotianae P10297]
MSISTSNKCPLNGSSTNGSKITFAALTRLLFTRLRINIDIDFYEARDSGVAIRMER